MNVITLAMIGFAYIIGSISCTGLLCRLVNIPDQNISKLSDIEAINILCINKPIYAFFILIWDIIKGGLPVWLAYKLDIAPFYLGIIAIAACLGHIYPIFFHFRGGKGVATAFGAIAPIGWDISGLLCITWLTTVIISGYTSLATIISALIAPLYVWWVRPELTFPVSMLSCLILICHHENIQRIWRGQENKVSKNFRNIFKLADNKDSSSQNK